MLRAVSVAAALLCVWLAARQVEVARAQTRARRAPAGTVREDRGFWRQRRKLLGLLSELFWSRPNSPRDLLRATDWASVQRKTEWVEAARQRSLRDRLPRLAELVRKRPQIAQRGDMFRQTALHYAAWVGAVEAVPILLQSGALVAARDRLNQTALHKAAIRGYSDVIAELLPHTPLDLRMEIKEFCSGAGSAVQPAAFSRMFGEEQRAPVTDPVPDSGRGCTESGGWAAPPVKRGECGVDRRSRLSAAEFKREYFMKGRPVLLQRAMPLQDRCAFARNAFEKQGLLHRSHHCGPTAYPSLTNQSHCEDGPFTVEQIEKGVTCTGGGSRYAPYCVHPPLSTIDGVHSTTLPYSLLSRRILETRSPAFDALNTDTWRSTTRFQFFMGATGSGAALHFHTDAYSALLFGAKTWMLTPPAHAGISGTPAAHWVSGLKVPGMEGGPMTCFQEAGDVMVLPAHWGHATLNHGMVLNIGNLFCADASEKGVDAYASESLGRCRRDGSLSSNQSPFFWPPEAVRSRRPDPGVPRAPPETQAPVSSAGAREEEREERLEAQAARSEEDTQAPVRPRIRAVRL